MPTVNVDRDYLFYLIGKTFTREEFDDICFQYGIELDDVIEEDNKVIYKIEVGANRYDLLCVEGIAICLRTFIGIKEFPTFKRNNQNIKIYVGENVEKIRPICMGAILRGITFTEKNYKSFIDFQDKIHLTIGKKRNLVSVGTHDLDTIKPPFKYIAKKLEDINFEPLKCDNVMNGVEILEYFEKDLKLQEYVPLLKGKEYAPLFVDDNGVVLSLPPLINGNHSKITLNTKNVFIDITGLDETKVMMSLQSIVTCFSIYSSTEFTIETVEVIGGPMNEYNNNKSKFTPSLDYQVMHVDSSYLNRNLGLQLDHNQLTNILLKMGISYINNIATIPPMRTDIMHACDVLEDVAISYGYNNLIPSDSITRTCGKEYLPNKMKDLLAEEIAYAGYNEVVTFVLMSIADASLHLRRPTDNLILIKESKTAEFQTARESLLSGMLKCLNYNKACPVPIKLFEIGDTLLVKEGSLVGAINRQQVCALICATTGLLEEIHGLLDKIMFCYGIGYQTPRKLNGPYYTIKPSNDPTYLDRRCADIYISDKKYGVMGVIHPEVLKNFDIDNPVVAIELYIDFPNGL